MKDQCKLAVAKALGKTQLTQQEADNIEQRIRDAMKSRARQDIDAWRNLSDSEKLTAAGEQVAIDIKADIKRKNKIAANDILTQSRNLAMLNHPTLPASQVIDRFIAAYGDMSGIKSIDSHADAIAKEAKGELTDYYTNVKGGLGIITNEPLVKNIIRETFKENTGDVLAKQISQQIEKVLDKNLRERFNRSGGDIGKLDKYGLPTHWDYKKIKDAGFDTWIQDALENFDRSSLIHTDGKKFNEQEVIEFLTEAFKTLESGGLNKLEPGRNGFGGGSKITSRYSESRVLHWKDADSWMDMQAKYGAMPFLDLIETHINGMAKDIAIVEKLGSNPNNAMRILKESAKKIDHDKGIDEKKVNRALERSDVMFDALMGKNTNPEFEVLNNLGIAYRSLNVSSLLGSALLSSASDLATMRKMANMHGISYRKMFGEMIQQLNPKNSEHRKLAASLGVAVDELTGSLARWGDDGLTNVYSKSSKIAKTSSSIATQVMRASLLNAWSAAAKRAFTKLMMDKYGRMTKEKSWTELTDIDRELLERTGIDEQLWKVMKVAEAIDDGKGLQLMSGRSIRKMTDEQILSVMDDDVKNLVDGINNQINELNQRNFEDDQRIANKAQQIDDLKQQFSQRLQDYANRTDSKSSAEKQALQDRIDLLNTQNEVAAAQVDINAYLQAEKQSNRIQDFLQQVEDGRHSDKAAQDTRKNVERNAGQYGRRGEELGKRLGNAERRMVELRAKIRKAESEANKSIDKKFNELDKRVKSLDEEFSQYQSRVNDRQAKRNYIVDSLNKSINSEKRELAEKLRDQFATQLHAHLNDEQGFAVVEAGLRERTRMFGRTTGGDALGFFARGFLQFKSFPVAFLMRHGSRMMAQNGLKGKAEYGVSLAFAMTLLGGLSVQLGEIALGNDPLTIWDSDDPNKTMEFWGRSALKGGGLSILGDIFVAGADPSGRDFADFLTGPMGGDLESIFGLTAGNMMQWYKGKDTNAANEAFKLAKSKTPAQNVWYAKAALNKMLFDEIQDSVAPGYREKLMRKAEREQGRTSWLGDFSWDDGFSNARAPDVGKVFGK
ncbi:hypothetical protein P7L54_04970 [Acinetobacter bereziniae]|uniref:hypothetical protein n=1 Tax=Acinetobacter bereziniae TaxID=106648 RepID=UPI0024122297|nr:hypothetical protein [Acinetobacter bereziniae]MDG3555301.1 hypothetical protein [Acinetobacter bereziniae]WMW75609.1 hypothetical protein RG306_04860 [Acinetobacter bereziniae]